MSADITEVSSVNISNRSSDFGFNGGETSPIEGETKMTMKPTAPRQLNPTVAARVGMKPRSTSYNFQELAKEEALSGCEEDIKALLESCALDDRDAFATNLNGFRKLFKQFVKDEKRLCWDDISPPDSGMIEPYQHLQSSPPMKIPELLNKLIVMKLNGGLGTSMGCTGPKSVITVRNDLTFLDMQVQQIEHLNNRYGCNIPLVLMNSFNTHDDPETEKAIRKYKHVNVDIRLFKQSQYPRIYKETFRSVTKDVNDPDRASWYPPGHGDMYQAFHNSGLLDEFIAQGKEVLFCSNIDNLGATVDTFILNHILRTDERSHDFIMEVTDKTRADVKGGTLIKYEAHLRLLELGQVPREHVNEFKSVQKFRIFNTNNLWMKLQAVKRLVENDRLHMEIIPNHKRLDDGRKVIQIETAIGAAIKCFDNAIGVNVPRSRFLPVKTCSDLFLVMSNLYEMHAGTLAMNPERQFLITPLVQLGTSFQKVGDYLSRFETIPNILELDHLTVSGDVTFGSNVTFKGTVIIIANHGERIDIPSGSILENKIISGNLRILNH